VVRILLERRSSSIGALAGATGQPADRVARAVRALRSDGLVAAGVRGILNFAPVSLTLPPEIALNAVDLAVQLEQLSFQVNFASEVSGQ